MILMDGAMGTYLMSLGVPPDSCFEALNLTRPSLIRDVHSRYAASGAKILVANTFGANRIRLGPWAGKLGAINRTGVRLARKAAPEAMILASIGPLGLKGQGLSLKQKRNVFREQARALAREKPDGLLVETMTSPAEAEAAVSAAREAYDGPVICLLAPVKTFRKRRPSFYRNLSRRLRSAGADVLGTNCGMKPKDGLDFFKSLAKTDPGPWCARPPAGKDFAAAAAAFKRLGCGWLGGCCGTTPELLKTTSRSL